nr:hypothetical protein [Tanacetum cinerariifolium]
MVACLEKTERNSEFHEIVDFLTSSTIHHALLKAVVVSEALIRSSLLFNDADGTARLTNEAIFQNLALMGYEGDQPLVTESSYSHDTTQNSKDSLEGTNRSEGDQVQSPYDSSLLGSHTYARSEGALNLEELFSICTNLSNRVLALETVKDAQTAEIIVLKARIKKLEKKCKPSISHHRACTFDGLDADHGMDTEEPVNERMLSEEFEELKLTTDTDEIAQDKGSGEKGRSTKELVITARPKDSTVRPDVGTADPIAPLTTTTKSIFDDEDITMAQTLIKIKEEKAKEKWGKGVLEEPVPVKKMTRSDLDVAQIAKDAEVARLVYEEELAEPPTKTQLRNLMMTYLKNIGGYKHSQLKAKTFKQIQGLYERQKRVINDFKPMDSDDAVDKENVLKEPNSTKVEVKQEGDEESIRKRLGKRLKMKATKESKRQKTDFDLKEEEHPKTFLQIVLDEEREVNYEVLD